MTTTVRPRSQFGSRRRLMVVAALIVIALGFLLFQGLGNATVYFKTADEAARQRPSLGTRRIRVEGAVVAGSVHEVGNDVAFRIENNGVDLDVLHRGDPPELFRDSIPVVLEGKFQGTTFDSDRIMVKHSATYTAKHPDRVQDFNGKGG